MTTKNTKNTPDFQKLAGELMRGMKPGDNWTLKLSELLERMYREGATNA